LDPVTGPPRPAWGAPQSTRDFASNTAAPSGGNGFLAGNNWSEQGNESGEIIRGGDNKSDVDRDDCYKVGKVETCRGRPATDRDKGRQTGDKEDCLDDDTMR
jgi:hypothetical protein